MKNSSKVSGGGGGGGGGGGDFTRPQGHVLFNKKSTSVVDPFITAADSVC